MDMIIYLQRVQPGCKVMTDNCAHIQYLECKKILQFIELNIPISIAVSST